MMFVVMKRKVPVLLIEVKPYVHLQRGGTRGETDDQMRRAFRDLVKKTDPGSQEPAKEGEKGNLRFI